MKVYEKIEFKKIKKQIAQANTVWRQTIATANTAALNEANMAEVMAANNLTLQGLAELWQQERDLMDFAWRSANNQLERDHQLLVNKITNDNAEMRHELNLQVIL